MLLNSLLYPAICGYLQSTIGVTGLFWAKNISMAFRGSISLILSDVKPKIILEVLLSRLFCGIVTLGVVLNMILSNL